MFETLIAIIFQKTSVKGKKNYNGRQAKLGGMYTEKQADWAALPR